LFAFLFVNCMGQRWVVNGLFVLMISIMLLPDDT
jgi:hypothetical protein